MIQEVSGDILLTKAELVAHGVAPNDHFDSGLALSLREQWPSMHKDFRHYCHIQHPEAGGIWVWSGPGARVANLLTQAEAPKNSHGHPGKATIEHVNHALRELAKFIKKEHIKSVALPRLATGVGGLDWNEVKPLIDHHLACLGIPVILYSTFHKGQQAAENL